MVQHLSLARVADGLGVAWNTANDAVLAEGKRILIDDEHRFDDVTVIIDLTGIRDGTGPEEPSSSGDLDLLQRVLEPVLLGVSLDVPVGDVRGVFHRDAFVAGVREAFVPSVGEFLLTRRNSHGPFQDRWGHGSLRDVGLWKSVP